MNDLRCFGESEKDFCEDGSPEPSGLRNMTRTGLEARPHIWVDRDYLAILIAYGTSEKRKS
jgi:hypothetical protein